MPDFAVVWAVARFAARFVVPQLVELRHEFKAAARGGGGAL
jgi:hypothetical protein